MKALVVYESRGGRTRRAAEAIAEAVRREGHDVTLRPLGDAGDADVEQADLLIVGSWVEGFILFGVRPAAATRAWVSRLPPLDGKRAAVFCTYAVSPRRSLGILRDLLGEKGADVKAERAFHRSRPEEGVEALVRAVL